jgi:hypothetical protein
MNSFVIGSGKLLRRISGPQSNGIREERRRLHGEKLYVVYSSPNIIRMINSVE